MKLVREVVVFDAADLGAESAFWAGILGGHTFEDEAWHSVIDAAGQWRIGVQGHPFCIGWGHPSQKALAAFVADRLAARRVELDK